MQRSLALVLVIFLSKVNAQVGINNTNPKASLDIVSDTPASPNANDGLLIPRLDKLPATNPTADQNAMMIYLNNDLTGVNISGIAKDYDFGFYYWDNAETDWVRFLRKAGWHIGGNDDARSGTHFIGTTNSEEVDFRVDNTFVARFTKLGQFELESEGKSILIGYEAGDDYVADPGTSEQNVYIGYQAGKDTDNAGYNVAVGTFAMTNNDDGDLNTAVGDETMANNDDGSRNSAFGKDALHNNDDGDDNTGVGYNALVNNTDGTGNTSVGSNAGKTNTIGTNNVFLGNNADTSIGGLTNSSAIGNGAQLTESNQIVLGNTAVQKVFTSGVVTAKSYIATVGAAIGYADYVFERYYDGNSLINADYRFFEIEEAEAFVKENGHLKGVKSYESIKNNDFKYDVATLALSSLEKIEEQFLYITQLNLRLKSQEEEIKTLKMRLERIEKLLEKEQ